MLLIAISAALALLGFSCGAYVGKGKTLHSGQSTILWFWAVVLTPATAAIYWIGGPAVILGVFLLFCLAEILALLMYCPRESSGSAHQAKNSTDKKGK